MIVDMKLLDVLSGKITTTPPIWFMRQAGRYLPEYRQLREQAGSFWNLCFTPKLAAEVTLQPLRRFDFDAAIIFSDILIIPHALGQKVDFLPNHGPSLEQIDLNAVIKSWQDQTYLPQLAPTLEALQIVRENLAPQQALIGFSGAPWTLLTYMLNLRKGHNFEAVLDCITEQRKEVDQLLTLLADVVAVYLIEQLKNGADVVKIFDSWAGVVPPAFRTKFILTPLQQIVIKVRQHFPNAPIIYFGREISDFYPEIIQQIPNLTFAFDQFIDPIQIRDQFQPLVPVQGNLNPEILVEGGEKLISATQKLLETLTKGPYVFNLGHGILPQTPLAHVHQVVDMVKRQQGS